MKFWDASAIVPLRPCLQRRYMCSTPLSLLLGLGSLAAARLHGGFQLNWSTLALDAEANARPGVIEKFNSEGLQGKLHITNGHCTTRDKFRSPCFHVSDRIHVNPGKSATCCWLTPARARAAFS